MRLPFSKERKVSWNLSDNLKSIEWAINEENHQHFVQDIKRLYPKIGRFDLQMPLIDPIRIGHHEYDSTWYEFHQTFLKALRRCIVNNEIDVDQWNSDVNRENSKRKDVADKHL